MAKSLKADILEHLDLKRGANNASSNVGKATRDFKQSNAPQFRGKSQKKRQQMAVAAGLAASRGESAQPKAGNKAVYEGKQALIQSINEATGMAVVKLPRLRDPKIVRLSDLSPVQGLNEAFLGMTPILPTWRDTGPSQFIRTDLTADDIGLDLIGLREDDDQEEPADNGSNIRHDGHTGEKEVDELPTPSDTIAPAYSDEKPPKIISKPLSTEPGAEESKLWQAPDWDGYDFPADAPEIPSPDFDGEDAGNSRAPSWGDIHEPGENQENREDDGDDEEVEESYMGFDKLKNKLAHKSGIRNPGAVAGAIGNKKYGKSAMHKHAASHSTFEGFVTEMDDLLGHGEDREPHSGDTIKLTLPALASIVCTVADKCQGNPELMKSMIEALDEVGHGKTIDIGDLDAVASHMNGEETQEVENRDAGHPDHQGMNMHGEDDDGADAWPGDGDKTRSGKTKLMGGMAESEDEEEIASHKEAPVDECDADIAESDDFYGWADMVAEHRKPTDEEEFREIKRRAGLKFW